MREADERQQRVTELVDIAEGYMSDAEFRDEYDARMIRYQQASCVLLQALAIQNEMVLELLREQRDLGLGG